MLDPVILHVLIQVDALCIAVPEYCMYSCVYVTLAPFLALLQMVHRKPMLLWL